MECGIMNLHLGKQEKQYLEQGAGPGFHEGTELKVASRDAY